MHPTATAYRVPFHLDRTDAPRRYTLVNTGSEPVDGLTLTHLGTGYAPPMAVRRLEPGRALSIAVFGAAPDDTGAVVLRWRRPDRSEYLWQVPLVAHAAGR
ncbi:hypothetical protein ABC270_06470 [Curtobacterium sp. 1P10AnD]|uniref:hypothetical protein n=1 Tax=Curtobacterium sp. 1P10AnD TaxID=3132283 RepID=UPI0039A15957